MPSARRLLGAALAAAALLAGPPSAGRAEARAPLDLGALAGCIADSGAVFYGAHWCPYCRKQMAAFGEHADALPYVECYDGPRDAGMSHACREAGVRGFPAWAWPDGRLTVGLKSPRALAQATGCASD